MLRGISDLLVTAFSPMAGWHAVLETGWLAGWFVKLGRGQ
jgi:hypothetical protein